MIAGSRDDRRPEPACDIPTLATGLSVDPRSLQHSEISSSIDVSSCMSANTLPVILETRQLIPSSHPHLQLALNSTSPLPISRCTAHLSLELPDALFVDSSSLPDYFASQPIAQWSIFPDTIDIERPVLPRTRALQHTNLDLIVEAGDGIVDLDIPLHARYLAPNEVGSEVISLESVISAGWVCGPVGMHDVLQRYARTDNEMQNNL